MSQAAQNARPATAPPAGWLHALIGVPAIFGLMAIFAFAVGVIAVVLARGGCRVTAHSGERDATVQARWERVTAALARHPAPENLAAPEGTEPA